MPTETRMVMTSAAPRRIVISPPHLGWNYFHNSVHSNFNIFQWHFIRRQEIVLLRAHRLTVYEREITLGIIIDGSYDSTRFKYISSNLFWVFLNV